MKKLLSKENGKALTVIVLILVISYLFGGVKLVSKLSFDSETQMLDETANFENLNLENSANEIANENTDEEENAVTAIIGNGKYIFKETKAIKLNKIFEGKAGEDTNNYNVYTLGGNVTVNIENKEITLKEAFEKGLVTTEDIISNVEKESQEGKCKVAGYMDGGSQEYYYENCTVLVTKQLMEPIQNIVFLRKGYNINSFNEMKNNSYDGPEYKEGIGKQYTVKEVISDNLLLVDSGRGNYFFADTSKADFDAKSCKYGDTLNIVYSGSYEISENYTVLKYTAFERGTYKDVPVKIIVSDDNSESTTKIEKIISEKLWVVGEEDSEYKDYLVIDEGSIIEGTPKEGSYVDAKEINENEMATTTMGGAIYTLKDVTFIEKK